MSGKALTSALSASAAASASYWGYLLAARRATLRLAMAQRHDAIGEVESNLIRSKVLTILLQRPPGADLLVPTGQTETKTRVRVFIFALVFIRLFLPGPETPPLFREVT
jgi:hypothetical protein